MLYKICRKNLHTYNATLKRCPECNKIRHDKYYSANKERYRKYYELNKDAVNQRSTERHYIRKYGITKEQKEQMMKEQKYKCANPGCDYIFSDLYDAQVDHNHSTGKVRGILCNGCNAAFGYLKENSKIILGLEKYRRKHDK